MMYNVNRLLGDYFKRQNHKIWYRRSHRSVAGDNRTVINLWILYASGCRSDADTSHRGHGRHRGLQLQSAISRWVSMVSSRKVNSLDSLIRGIELLMIGTSFGTTIFLLLKAIAVWNALSFSAWFLFARRSFSVFSHAVSMFLISVSSARIAAMAAMDGSIRNLISIRSLIIFCLSSTKVRPKDHQSSREWRKHMNRSLAYGDYITWCECSHSFTQRASSNIQPFTHYGFRSEACHPAADFSSSMYLIILSAILWERVFSLEFCMWFASCCPIPWCLVFLFV